MTDTGIALPSPVIEVHDDRLRSYGVRLWLKRDDLIDSLIPGNKWRKLKHNLAGATTDRPILTFGGAYSHHIAATAAAGHRYGLATIGVIRGEERLPLNPVLTAARDHGMRLTYLDRTTYRRKTDPPVVARLRSEFGDVQMIPEGGSNAAGVVGCRELGGELAAQLEVDWVCCPVGSGGTLAGLAAGVADGTRVLGVSVLGGTGFLDPIVAELQREAFGTRMGDWRIAYGFHHGGYAKRSPQLTEFIDRFDVQHGVRLEPIYVAKALYAVYRLVADGQIATGSRIAAVVTGPPMNLVALSSLVVQQSPGAPILRQQPRPRRRAQPRHPVGQRVVPDVGAFHQRRTGNGHYPRQIVLIGLTVAFGQRLDQGQHRFGNPMSGKIIDGRLGVLDDIVQQRRHTLMSRSTGFGDELGHGARMMDVRPTALVPLSPVIMRGQTVHLGEGDRINRRRFGGYGHL